MSNIKIDYDIKSKEMDEMPRSARVDLEYSGELTLQICNNFLDDAPAWEGAEIGAEHDFLNISKTAQRWCVGVRVQIADGEEEAYSYTPAILVSTNAVKKGTDITPTHVEYLPYTENIEAGVLVQKQLGGPVRVGRPVQLIATSIWNQTNNNIYGSFAIHQNGRWLIVLEAVTNGWQPVKYEITPLGELINRTTFGTTLSTSSISYRWAAVYFNDSADMFCIAAYNSTSSQLRFWHYTIDAETGAISTYLQPTSANYSLTVVTEDNNHGMIPGTTTYFHFPTTNVEGRLLKGLFNPGGAYTVLTRSGDSVSLPSGFTAPVWLSETDFILNADGYAPKLYHITENGTTFSISQLAQPSWEYDLMVQYPSGYCFSHFIDGKLLGYVYDSNPLPAGNPTRVYNPFIVCEVDPDTLQILPPTLSEEVAENVPYNTLDATTGYNRYLRNRGLESPIMINGEYYFISPLSIPYDAGIKILKLVGNKLVKTAEHITYVAANRNNSSPAKYHVGVFENTVAGLMYILLNNGLGTQVFYATFDIDVLPSGLARAQTIVKSTDPYPYNIAGYGVAQETGLQGDWHNVVMFGEGE